MRKPFYISSNCPKHYYAGIQRVSSKIGTTENLGNYLYDWFTGGMGGPVDVIGTSLGVLENAEQGVVQVYDELGIDPPTYESTPVFIPVQNFTHGGNEVEQYFFHPDHLGSTSYITNLLGEVSQHMEYFAFGETFVEEHRSSNNSPYKFNGKELDEDTGWYYYGARYYDPRTSVWLSVDPLASYNPIFEVEHYIDGQHNGGVYNSMNLSVYGYCYQSPINYIDPNGKQVRFGGVPGYFALSVSNNIKIGHEYKYLRATTDKNKMGAYTTAYWNVMSGQIHMALDVVGLIPVAGEVADGVNGFIYLIEGDNINAGLSFASMVPFVGWATTGTKFGLKVAKNVGGEIVQATIKNADEYYQAVSKLKTQGERVAAHKKVFEEIAENSGWKRAKNIESKNTGRTVYQGDNGSLYSLDSQHGHIEILNKNGKHQGSIRFDGKDTGKGVQPDHNLNTK